MRREADECNKWKSPKLREVFIKNLQLLAEKYELRGTPRSTSGSATGSGSPKSDGANPSDPMGGRAKGSGAKGRIANGRSGVKAALLAYVRQKHRLQRFCTRLRRPQELARAHPKKRRERKSLHKGWLIKISPSAGDVTKYVALFVVVVMM